MQNYSPHVAMTTASADLSGKIIGFYISIDGAGIGSLTTIQETGG